MGELTDDGVKIYAPDMTLKKKLGPGVTFESVVTPQVMQAAEKVFADAQANIMQELENEMQSLVSAYDQLGIGSPPTKLQTIGALAFAVKSKAGICGFGFASDLARSLNVYCEMDHVRGNPLTPRTVEIISCHVRGLQLIFTHNMVGDGGAVGAEIMQELARLTDQQGLSLSNNS
ncbi:MAG: hypothetical protein JO126_03640 [Alphaproteobacteria bacterium]|nr:hypothetical protein [Alphaproteobacteria bacterium]MBV8548531.1 hypothetical protein [Alphaproteobacteria bacterium]